MADIRRAVDGGLRPGTEGPIAARVAAGALVLCAFGCAPAPDPYCTEYDDPTGRALALCRNDRQHAVCDTPGDTARFERDGSGTLRLLGGAYAFCDEARQVVCADRTRPPRCLAEPE